MSAALARRWWRSFTGGSRPRLSQTVERGRDGYSLVQRTWASFIGLDLRPVHLTTAPAHEASTTNPKQATAGGQSRYRQQARGTAQGWFPLPPVVAGTGVTAAGSDSLVLETASPDGRVRFLVRSRGNLRPEYSLELVLLHGADATRPMMTTVRYPMTDGSEQVLLVPVLRGQVGPAASYVRLPGFIAGVAWTASPLVPVISDIVWDAATIAESVHAVLNEATRDAWRKAGELLDDDLRGLVEAQLS